MKEKKQWLIRLFIILFSVSVSVAVLPCGIINTHGLFGEITSSTITNDDNSSFQESRVIENRRQIKGINIYNIWFEVWICVIVNTAFLGILNGEKTMIKVLFVCWGNI